MIEMQVRFTYDGQEVHREVSAMVEIAIELRDANPLASSLALLVAKGMRADLERRGRWLGGNL